MTEQKKTNFDHTLIRLKDFILIGGAFYSFIAFGGGFIGLPPRVEATEIEVKNLQKADILHDLKIQELNQNFEYIKKSLEQIQLSQNLMMKKVLRENIDDGR